MNKGLLLFESRDLKRHKGIVDIFKNYWIDYNAGTRIAKSGRIIYRVWAYVEKETENRIRQEVHRLDKPGYQSTSFIFDTVR